MRRSFSTWHRRLREKVSCDRCGFTYRDGDLVEQDGIMVCPKCYDEPSHDDYERGAAQ